MDDTHRLEPIPETLEAIEEWGPFTDDDLVARLRAAAAEVRRHVPSCVGLSLAVFHHDITFTLVASDVMTASLDGVQYLTDGPCVAAVARGEAPTVREYDREGLLDEEGWAMFARATADNGINATLTLPIVGDRVEGTARGAELDDGTIVGSVNLYASDAGAFNGHHETVAAAFGGWAPGAVTNADLDFSTLAAARSAPGLQRDQVTVSRAAALFAETVSIPVDDARDRIAAAAAGARVSAVSLAETILRTMAPASDS